MKLSDLSRYLEERFGTKENRDKHFRAHVTQFHPYKEKLTPEKDCK